MKKNDTILKFIFLMSVTFCNSQISFSQSNLYSDNFSIGISNWKIEANSDETVINSNNGVLEVIAPAGITLWFNQQLKGNICIEYDVVAVDNGGKYDRVSDLNCFWMASDPDHPDSIFKRSDWRNGVFGRYYSLQMYYVGYGGNNNSTTRFRRYDGDYKSFELESKRPDVIKEYTDSLHLIVPNVWNHIMIVIEGNIIQYYFNEELLFDYKDDQVFRNGYFGLRTVKNHMKVKRFKVSQLP